MEQFKETTLEIEEASLALDMEEALLMKDLDSLHSQMEALDPDLVHKQMLEALQKEALNSIAIALDISDICEHRPEKNSIYTEVIGELKVNNDSFNDRKNKYLRSTMTGQEFNAGVKRIEVGAKNEDGSIIHVDCYTGEELQVGNVNDRYDHEHVISAKELSNSFFTGLFLNEKEIREFANSDKNLKVTRSGINRSKGSLDLKKWLKKDFPGCPGITNAEYYGIDLAIANKTYDEAYNELRKRVAIKATGMSIFMGTETVVNVTGYAVKQAIGKLLKIIIKELINEFKEKCLDPLKERFNRVLAKISTQIKYLCSEFKESAVNNFVSTVLDAVMNIFLDTTKKIFKIVRMLWKPILQAIKIIISSSSEYSLQERLLSASKIIGAALMGVLGLFLNEVINTALCAIPGVAVLAPYLSPILSSFIVGMVSTLILQGYDIYKKGKQLVECKTKEGQIYYELECIAKKKIICAEYNSRVIQLQMADAFSHTLLLYEQCCDYIDICKKEIDEQSSITENTLKDTVKTLNEINEILNIC